MNDELWTSESAKKWGECMAMAKRRWKLTRFARRFNGVAAVYFALTVSVQWFHLPTSRPWLSISDLLFTWVMYRFYLSNLYREKLWSEIVYHQTRMCVETQEMGMWHSQQMDLVLKKLASKNFWTRNERHRP